MNNAPSFWIVPPGYWSIEQAICYLAFGKPDEPLVPERSPSQTTGEWLKIRSDRENESIAWVRDLENALNSREVQASGGELPLGLWKEPDLPQTGVALEDRATIERTARGKNNKSRFRLCIDPNFRYINAGIALVLKNDAAGLMNLVKVYVMVDLPAARVRQLKRQLDADRARRVGEPKQKLRVGRPPISARVMEIYFERDRLGRTHPVTIEEAKACCELYKNEKGADDLNPDTLARKIGAHRKENA